MRARVLCCVVALLALPAPVPAPAPAPAAATRIHRTLSAEEAPLAVDGAEAAEGPAEAPLEGGPAFPAQGTAEAPLEGGPAFPAQGTALLAAAGGAAELRCAVLRLGHKAVSWVRSRDLQILSHAGAVFTADRRVSAGEGAGAGALSQHALRIAPLRRTDSGRYECQLNTEPKMSLFFNLTVLDELPTVRVWISEGPALAARAGGGVTMTCEARFEAAGGGAPPLDPVWEKDGHPITFQSSLGGVLLERERWAGGARAALRLAAVARRDAGLYRCGVRAPPAPQAHAVVQLTVTDDETGAAMEAMQRDEALAQARGGAGAGAGAGALLAALAAAALLA